LRQLSRFLIAVLAFVPACVVWAVPAIQFNEATGGNGTNANQSVGWQFNVLAPITVTGLGWFDQGGDGLGHEHTVGIWGPGGALLTSILVPTGVAASLDGQYRTVPIAPLLLSVGDGYIVSVHLRVDRGRGGRLLALRQGVRQHGRVRTVPFAHR
jgi:hypothetical protein